MLTHWHRLILIGVLSLLATGLVYPQEIHYDSGYTWRAYTGTTSPVCPEKLCHHNPVYAWDSYYGEFTAWKSFNGLSQSAHAFMNFRVIFPPGYDFKNNSIKYPLIVVLHGAGESGRVWTGFYSYLPTDPRFDNNGDQLRYGGDEHRIAVAKSPLDPKAFPGIVVFPQSSYSSNWGDPASSTINENEALLLGFIEDQLVARYHVDINRIVIHGLSNGAKGLWTLAQKRPDLFAAILPMSGLPLNTENASTVLLTTPIRIFQGGLDINPTPNGTNSLIKAFNTKGGTPELMLYPDLGHPVWDRAYKEPDFFSWILKQNKRNIYVFGGLPQLCGDSIKLGFSGNMKSYQWTRNGVELAGATGRYLENVNRPGIYRVKFQRQSGQWDESTPTIVTPRPGCVITGLAEDDASAAAYPNPTTGKVVITLNHAFDASSVKVVSLIGQASQWPVTQISGQSAELDLTGASTGLYLVRVNGSGRTFRIVKE